MFFAIVNGTVRTVRFSFYCGWNDHWTPHTIVNILQTSNTHLCFVRSSTVCKHSSYDLHCYFTADSAIVGGHYRSYDCHSIYHQGSYNPQSTHLYFIIFRGNDLELCDRRARRIRKIQSRNRGSKHIRSQVVLRVLARSFHDLTDVC